MRIRSLAGLLVGFAALGAVFAWQGVARVLAPLAEGGWALLLVCVFAVPAQALAAEAWRSLFHPASRPRPGPTLLASWIGSAVNTLLPAAGIGGEIVKAHLLTRWGARGVEAAGTTIVDKTVQAIVVLVWGLVGIIVLATLVADSRWVWGACLAGALLALGILGFIAAQIAGGTLLARAARRRAGSWWQGLAPRAQSLQAGLRAVYARPGAFALGCAFRLTQSVILVAELMLATYLMGHPIGLAEAVMVKALASAMRGIAFAVPAGLGIQEGGYVLVGALVGLPAPLMLAASLASRAREIIPSIPALALWQLIEGRAWWRRALERSPS